MVIVPTSENAVKNLTWAIKALLEPKLKYLKIELGEKLDHCFG